MTANSDAVLVVESSVLGQIAVPFVPVRASYESLYALYLPSKYRESPKK